MNADLASLADRYWSALMEHEPTWASVIGDHRFDDRMEDLSLETEDALIGVLDSVVAGANAIDPAGLTAGEQLDRECLITEARAAARLLRAQLADFAVDPIRGLHIKLLTSVPYLRPQDETQATKYVDKAARVGEAFDAAITRLRHGIAVGRTPPRVAVEKSIGQLDAYLARPMDQDPFLQIPPPEDMSDARVSGWRHAMGEVVASVVRPGFARYREALMREALPVARPPAKSGLCWLPGGEEMYAASVGYYTTLDLDPHTIHQMGLDEVAALEEEYAAAGAAVLDTSEVPEIYDRLRTDPALRFSTPEEVEAQAERALRRAEAAVPRWFGRLPKAPCVVERIPEVGAGDSTIAYYLPPAQDGTRPGVYFINATEPTTRTIFESEALTFHESVPGHHLQLAIAQEIEDLPAFRRNSMQTAYVEGWGLYTERLCDEMGLYSGDLERMGILSFDSWRACRLVVDTGMHAMGWGRQEAIDYMTANSPQAPNNISNEVDRYIGYAGQALAYKLGQREIVRLRSLAERRLGARFDIRAFHDALLGSGPLPLPVLAETMEAWAAEAAG